jgi:hypothetical protein
MEQLVARRAHNPKVASSSLAPATKTIKRLYYYSVTVFLFKKTSFKYSQRLIEVLPAIIRTVQNSIEKVWRGLGCG